MIKQYQINTAAFGSNNLKKGKSVSSVRFTMINTK